MCNVYSQRRCENRLIIFLGHRFLQFVRIWANHPQLRNTMSTSFGHVIRCLQVGCAKYNGVKLWWCKRHFTAFISLILVYMTFTGIPLGVLLSLSVKNWRFIEWLQGTSTKSVILLLTFSSSYVVSLWILCVMHTEALRGQQEICNIIISRYEVVQYFLGVCDIILGLEYGLGLEIIWTR